MIVQSTTGVHTCSSVSCAGGPVLFLGAITMFLKYPSILGLNVLMVSMLVELLHILPAADHQIIIQPSCDAAGGYRQ